MGWRVKVVIGIDPGVNTGVAVADGGKLVSVGCMAAVKAEEMVLQTMIDNGGKLFVRFEDARMRQWFGSKGREALQGAGSIKRDCSRWQEFLEHHNIPHARIAPKANRTKLTADQFKRITGWQGRTNEHSRDAAMLVFV
jgi:hypothetical protein